MGAAVSQEGAAEPPYRFPVHEPAWCPWCLAWLGTFPSKEDARAYEASLANHPVEFCLKQQARLNASQEWTQRSRVGRFGSLAAERPKSPRIPKDAEAEAALPATVEDDEEEAPDGPPVEEDLAEPPEDDDPKEVKPPARTRGKPKRPAAAKRPAKAGAKRKTR